MAGTYLQEGQILDHTPAGAVTNGDLVRIGSRLGVALNDIAAGEVGPVQIAGVFRLPKVTANVVAVGALINFDASAGNLTTATTAAAGDLTAAAMAVAAADGTVSEVDVLLGNFGTAS